MPLIALTFRYHQILMPILSSELSVSPEGELILGLHAVFGEIHDIESGEELFIPSEGFRICGLCDAVPAGADGYFEEELAWITAD